MTKIEYHSILVKLYGRETGIGETRYSPPVCIGARHRRIIENPRRCRISTSFVERRNLPLQMTGRRFTRLNNAFSKKIENHKRMMAIHAVILPDSPGFARDTSNGSWHCWPCLEP